MTEAYPLEKMGQKEEKQLGGCPNCFPGCVLEVVLLI